MQHAFHPFHAHAHIYALPDNLAVKAVILQTQVKRLIFDFTFTAEIDNV